MPLRSVEAATRDDAIAAAREQFGPQARIVGVRRVRSGGVLGFFAVERYVAEVASDVGRPPGPAAPRGSRGDLGSSPLASAAPATAAPSSVRARAGAPARNGAAAYAAEARSTVSGGSAVSGRSARPATRFAMEGSSRATASAAAARPAEPRVDDARLSELAGLLGATAPEPEAPTSARAQARTGDVRKVTFQKAPWTASPAGTASRAEKDDDVPQAEPPAANAPSPFTAALARMVAGDAHVRQAVEQAVEEVEEQSAARNPRGEAERRPVRSTPARSADTAVWPRAARQEEETVGNQVMAPPSMPADRPVETSTWAAEPESAASPGDPREAAIAEALRSALARGHSDEALDGILRTVLDGAPPQAALAEPAQPAGPGLLSDAVVAEPPGAPTGAEPVDVWSTPAAEPPGAPTRAEPVDVWSTPAAAPLWREATPPARVVPADARPTATVPVEEPIAEVSAAAPEVVEFVAPSASVTEEADVAATAVEEMAPLMARTASDPAPFAAPMTMSQDATSVMPPLSLLPPLSSSRGRGRPPVPPSTSRRPLPPSQPAAQAEPTTPDTEEQVVPAAPPATGPAPSFLATVTRLPIPPLAEGPGGPEPVEQEIARLEDPGVDVLEAESDPVAEVADPAPASVPVETPEEVRPEEASAAPGDVVSRLAALGLPTRLLGETFAADVERHGIYAALTRALGLRLPAAPQLPTGAGEVLFVVGAGVETLRAARALASSLCLDPDRVQWATPGDLAGLAPASSRMSTVEAALARRRDAANAGTLTIVAVHAPMRTDVYWMEQMLAIWSPVAVWAVVEATRKPEDVQPWLDGMTRVDALIVQDTDLSADPAAMLHRVVAPVAVLDGVRATPHRWASLLCERLEDAEA